MLRRRQTISPRQYSPKRRLSLWIFTALSALWFAIVVTLWFRSDGAGDEFIYGRMDADRPAATAVAFGTSDAGEIGFIAGRAAMHVRTGSWLFNGFDYERPAGSFAVYDHSAAMAGFHTGRFRLRWGTLNAMQWSMKVIGFTVPTWLMAAGLFGLAAFGTTRLIRNRPAFDPGICQRCGYDLRATPGRCPECGAIAGTTQPFGSAPNGTP